MKTKQKKTVQRLSRKQSKLDEFDIEFGNKQSEEEKKQQQEFLKACREWRVKLDKAVDEQAVYESAESILKKYDDLILDIVCGERMDRKPLERYTIIYEQHDVRNLLLLISKKPRLCDFKVK